MFYHSQTKLQYHEEHIHWLKNKIIIYWEKGNGGNEQTKLEYKAERLKAQMCTQKGAEILTIQNVAVSTVSCNHNLNEGNGKVCGKMLHSCLILVFI